jgi:hypothetical protein
MEFNGSFDMENSGNSKYSSFSTAMIFSAVLAGCVSLPPQPPSTPVAVPANPPPAASSVAQHAVPATTAAKPLEKTAFSGVPQYFGFYAEVNADCTPIGRPTLIVTHPPSHGTIALDNARDDYPNFSTSNQRYDCNKSKVPGVGVIYASDRGFVGTDHFSVKRVSHAGDAANMDYIVTVEPAQ